MRRFHFESLNSTQIKAIELMATNTAPYSVLADFQTKGMGRQGRGWISGEGDYLASFVFPLSNAQLAPKLSLITSLALIDTLKDLNFETIEELQIKWPNDVLLSDKKIAGILGQYVDKHAVIGIGVNLQNAPTDKEIREESFSATMLNITNRDGFHQIFEFHMKARYEELVKFGFDRMRMEISKCLYTREVMFVDNDNQHALIPVKLNEEGALIARIRGELREIWSGDLDAPRD